MFNSGGHAGLLHKLMLYEISVKIISLFITTWYTLHVVFRQKLQELDTKQVPKEVIAPLSFTSEIEILIFGSNLSCMVNQNLTKNTLFIGIGNSLEKLHSFHSIV